MLMKFYKLDSKGNYTAPPKRLKRISYITMTRTRMAIVKGQAAALAKAVTIAIRYNAVRHQGFNNTKADSPIETGERCILDYRYQQYRLFSQLSLVFAIFFGYKDASRLAAAFETALAQTMADTPSMDVNLSDLPELHATSAGMKSWCTKYAIEGIETVRLCCGGQGYALSSGIASVLNDFLPAVTYEGDHVILSLQTARYLLRTCDAIDKGEVAPRRVAYLGEQLPSRCPARTPAEFRNMALLKTILGHRAHASVRRAQATFNKHLAAGMPYDVAWSESHLDLMKAAEHHVACMLVSAYSTEHGKICDAAITRVFARLGAMYGLCRIRESNPAIGRLATSRWSRTLRSVTSSTT